MKDPTDEALRKAGWYPHRRVDVSAMVEALVEAGYAPTNAVRQFLAQYGGLSVTFPKNSRLDSLTFDVAAAAAAIDPDWIESYSKRAGVSLVPVGEAYHRHLVVMVADDGAVYAAYDDLLLKYGNNADDAIDAIVTVAPASRVP